MKLDLEMLAVVPVGHEVVIQAVEMSGIFGTWHLDQPIVLDRATGVVWSSDLVAVSLNAETFATENLGPELRRKGAPIVAKVAACHVRSRKAGQAELVSTTLTLVPIDASVYR